MSLQWPTDWHDRVAGTTCEMCESPRLDSDQYGIRIHTTKNVDAMLQRADIQRGYTLVIWRGRHVVEPYDLTDDEATSYWREVLRVAKALSRHYQPIKMNYETLGNTVPHLHTHLVPRYTEDPAPGRPFPLLPQNGSELPISDSVLRADAIAIRALLRNQGSGQHA
jgi:diadenosine tetraphosphate (Ap4A) HIT family hydrolase